MGCLTFEAAFFVALSPFTIRNTFSDRFVFHFDKNLIFVVLEHDFGQIRVPFHEKVVW